MIHFLKAGSHRLFLTSVPTGCIIWTFRNIVQSACWNSYMLLNAPASICALTAFRSVFILRGRICIHLGACISFRLRGLWLSKNKNSWYLYAKNSLEHIFAVGGSSVEPVSELVRVDIAPQDAEALRQCLHLFRLKSILLNDQFILGYVVIRKNYDKQHTSF